MAYQFFHFETYGRKPTKAGRSNHQFNSTAQVFGEAMRTSKYSTHIANPRPPVVLTREGAIPPSDLQAIHDTKVSEIKIKALSALGNVYHRQLKSDAKTLYTEIHSHPTVPSLFLQDDDAKQDVIKWLNMLTKDFKRRMKDDVLFSAVVHFDESHVHCHILAININDPKLDANKLHVGKAAAAKYRQEHPQRQIATSLPRPAQIPSPPKPRKPRESNNPITQSNNQHLYAQHIDAWHQARTDIKHRNKRATQDWKQANSEHLKTQRKERSTPCCEKLVYKQALIDAQDRYYDAVGKPCGLLRVGPRAQRLTRKEANVRKAEAKRLAETQCELETRSVQLLLKEQRIATTDANLRIRQDDINNETKRLLESQKELRLAQEAIADAVHQLTGDNVQLGGIVFNAYVYDAYDIPELNRTAMQHQVTTLIDGLILAHKRAGKSTGPKPNYTNRIG